MQACSILWILLPILLPEVCELVGLFILNGLSSEYGKESIGLYRDDGLAIFKNISGPQTERIRKNITRHFKNHGLKITTQTNLKIVIYLDVTFNLTDGSYYARRPCKVRYFRTLPLRHSSFYTNYNFRVQACSILWILLPILLPPEVCELVGLFILNGLSSEYGKESIGLYRDDGLAIFKNISGSQTEQNRKNITRHFKNHGLKITIQTNLKIVNYLDVTFNLTDGSYYPYRKPNNLPQYINIKSNHPPNIIKQLISSSSFQHLSTDVFLTTHATNTNSTKPNPFTTMLLNLAATLKC